MTTSYKTLYQDLLTATTVTTTYSVPAGLSAIIGTITFVNVSSVTSSTLKVWQVPTAVTSEGDAYVMLNTITIGPGEKYVLSGPKTVATGVAFKVQAGTANILNCLVEGAEVGGTTDAWGNAGASAYKTATNHTSTGNWQAVTWETELWDIDGMHAASASTFVCTVAGKYLVTANVNFASNATGRRLARINKNSGASYHGYAEKDPVTGDITPVIVSGVVDLSVGDTITIDGFQSSGGNLAYAVGAATSGSSQVSAVRVGYQTNPGNTLNLATQSVSANYSATILDHTIRVDASGGARTITLPAVAATPTGFVLVIKKTDSSANNVTIDGNASETIDGATTKVLSAQYAATTVQNNGTSWDIL